MLSSFQFSNPSLLNLSFNINKDFSPEENHNVSFDIKTEVEVGPGPEDNSAVVILKMTIGPEDASVPFSIYAEEGAVFRWNAEKINSKKSEKLLKQNAPALLLSYLRPSIAVVTSASPFEGYNIPFMNFVE